MSTEILNTDAFLSSSTGTTAETRSVRFLMRMTGILLVTVALTGLRANFATLITYPVLQTDEAWYANLAYNWLTTGNRWTTLDLGPFPDGKGQGTTPLGAIPTRLAIQTLGLNLSAIRLPSLVAGLVLLLVLATIGTLLWSRPTGLLASLILLLQPLFLLGSHMARPEIWLALVVMAALGCSLLGWKRRQPLWDALAALLVIFSVELHQNGAIFAIGLAASYLARYRRQVFQQPGSLAFLGINLLGGAFYFYRQMSWLLPQRAAASSFQIVGSGSSHSIPLLDGNPATWFVSEIVRYLVYFGNEPLGAVLFGLGIMAALRRRQPADQVLLAWLAGSALAMMLLVSHQLETYLLPMLAVGALLTGRTLMEMLQAPEAWGRQVAILLVIASALPMLLLIARSNPAQIQQFQQALQQTVPCTRILGPNQYWLAFTNCEYRSWDVISHYRHIQNLPFQASMATVQPDYLLIDQTVLAKLREDFEKGGTTGSYYAMPEADFNQFLQNQTTLVDLLEAPGYGTVQIRKVHWETTP